MLLPQQKLLHLLSICLLGVSSSVYAATDPEDAAAYVDSVNEWGAWELGIEPAAGGPTPTSSRALNARSANVTFRPKENNAVTPVIRAIPITRPAGGTLPTGVPGQWQ